MDEQAFRARLARDGYQEVLLRQYAPGAALATHTHPFTAHALVTAGELTLTVDGKPTAYRAGDIFHLDAGTPHAEQYGEHGATYLVGRKT